MQVDVADNLTGDVRRRHSHSSDGMRDIRRWQGQGWRWLAGWECSDVLEWRVVLLSSGLVGA